jgi:deoxyribodipyrimidine photolyase-related protein
MKIFLILPTQLFKDIKILKHKKNYDIIYLLEDPYYLNPTFHKQKLLLHISSLNYYYDYLVKKSINVKYIKYNEINYDKVLKNHEITMYDPVDKYIRKQFKKFNIEYLDTPLFLNTNEELDNYYELHQNKKKFMNIDFYKWMRIKLNILMKNSKPIYDNWSFDKENRNPFDKGYKEDELDIYDNKYIKAGKLYVNKHFKEAFGNFDEMYYPNNHKEAEKHLNIFIKGKLFDFGKYQDSISKDVVYGNHANISALINIGLLTPLYVIDTIIAYFNKYKDKKKIINSVEAIIRQILGWREYMRFIYVYYRNDIIKYDPINNNRSIPKNWYTGNTSLEILNHYIEKVQNYAYLHHIERLMIINNLFVLCEIRFIDIYNWFMICFIDSYDWVMVPNIYMNLSSLNKDIKYMTKIYVASDNYIKKMSDFRNKQDFEIINKLYWNFVKKNKNILKHEYSIKSQVNKFL